MNVCVYYSSELRPASEQGLLALSVLGMVTSDITLAAAALAELVKIGQKGWFIRVCSDSLASSIMRRREGRFIFMCSCLQLIKTIN